MAFADYKRPNISLTELYNMKQKKEVIRTRSFDQIMELCHRRIRNIASYGGMNCFYEIPGILIGYPLYHLEECTQYIIDKLRTIGFLVQLLPPPNISVIYISWDPQEIKPKRAALMGPSSSNHKHTKVDKQDKFDKYNKNNNMNDPLIRGNIQETKMITADVTPKVRITNPLKDRFRIF